ncbi:MAG: nucleoside-diphosphate-sugar epimerase [Candidatus Endobugula sp.]|jgi:nucleoside-diphosphate-sugar epimerase
MKKEKIALLGFGDIANRLSSYLSEHHVVGVKRSKISHPSVTIDTADCCDPLQMERVLSVGFDVLVITFTPTEMSDAGYEQGYVVPVKAILAALNQQTVKPRLIVFVSSTSVYAQKNGSWVDEQSPAEPESYSGRRLREAEELIAASDYTYCHVRFSGIYGRGLGHVVEQVMAGKGTAKKPVVYTNRIHADDCAGVLAHLIQQQKEQAIQPIYIASDHQPTSLHEVKEWMRRKLSLPDDHFQQIVPMAARTLRSNKRCSNQQLLDSGYVFIYPSFKQGYATLL